MKIVINEMLVNIKIQTMGNKIATFRLIVAFHI